jgi:hypothetical protein
VTVRAWKRRPGGGLNAFEVDRALLQYSRGAKELWKFCNMTDIESTADLLSERPVVDRWDRGAPKR